MFHLCSNVLKVGVIFQYCHKLVENLWSNSYGVVDNGKENTRLLYSRHWHADLFQSLICYNTSRKWVYCHLKWVVYSPFQGGETSPEGLWLWRYSHSSLQYIKKEVQIKQYPNNDCNGLCLSRNITYWYLMMWHIESECIAWLVASLLSCPVQPIIWVIASFIMNY